ncbi:MAG: hypothetical protein HRT44_05970 [Bdellovibrionales bacterium]|nr:hypothetical protein [Bdellovibrionales bacterium]NQZ18789.1 hypothetical protein [Bdellovibrionales bacterium]
MKKLASLIILLAFQANFAQAADLKDIMKAMGGEFITIAIAMQAGSVSETELAAVENLQKYASEAALVYPITADTDSQKLRYMELTAEMMNKALLLETAVEEALANDPTDLSQIQALFVEINELRQIGHNEFKLD